MQHLVSLSGGTASAVAADRVIKRYLGHDNVMLWFADTSWEHPDLHRFLDDLQRHWGLYIFRHKDGRNPLEVAEKAQLIPNQRRAPCTLELKIKPFRDVLARLEKPVTVHLGLDWTEQHRQVRPKAEYEAIEGVTVDLPLMWDPVAMPPHRKEVESWGLTTPQLYNQGFPHNNCGGSCVKQGIGEWVRLRWAYPERFRQVRDWEQEQRAKGGARANFAIARDQRNGTVLPLTLLEIEARFCQGEQMPLEFAPSQEDVIGCYCT